MRIGKVVIDTSWGEDVLIRVRDRYSKTSKEWSAIQEAIIEYRRALQNRMNTSSPFDQLRTYTTQDSEGKGS